MAETSFPVYLLYLWLLRPGSTSRTGRGQQHNTHPRPNMHFSQYVCSIVVCICKQIKKRAEVELALTSQLVPQRRCAAAVGCFALLIVVGGIFSKHVFRIDPTETSFDAQGAGSPGPSRLRPQRRRRGSVYRSSVLRLEQIPMNCA